MITLGIYSIPDPNDKAPCNTHDHGVALMENGKVVAMAELERLTRQKHDNKLYLHLDSYVAKKYFHLTDPIQAVFVDSYWGHGFSTPSGLIHMEAKENKLLSETIQPASGQFSDKNIRIWLCPHELAHVGSCLPFTGGFEENSLLIHIDGGASQSDCSAWHYRNGQIRHLHHSWQFKTHNINYEDNPLTCAILGINCDESVLLSVAGKLMGYASFGTAHPELKDWLALNNWFQNRKDGLNRFKEYAARDHGWSANGFDIQDKFLMDVAACMQAALYEDVEKYIFSFQEQTGAKHLYYSGGVALNIHINSNLENSGRFESIHIPPCCQGC